MKLLAALLVPVTLVAATRSESPGPPPPEMLERVAVIGASMSDGFLLPLEVDAMVTFADFVQAATKTDAGKPFRRSSALFFQDPPGYAERFAAAARRHDPTLVIAIDYLFWFGYGATYDDHVRVDWLDVGLSFLEEFECPVLIADFPDMRRASTVGVGIHGAPMIHPIQVPSPEGLKLLNDRVAEWAAARENVHVVKIAKLLERIHRGQAVEVRGNRWPENSQATLLDEDLLHTTFEGTAALVMIALDTLVRERDDVGADAFLWDKDLIMKRVLAPRDAERRQRGARGS